MLYLNRKLDCDEFPTLEEFIRAADAMNKGLLKEGYNFSEREKAKASVYAFLVRMLNAKKFKKE